MTDYTQAVYEYIRTLGGVGDEVKTAIWPYLSNKFDLSPAEATSARRRAMQELTARGAIERINVRGPYVRILG